MLHIMNTSHNKQLVLLRHGQSTWNRDNRFTGWTDVPLSDHGHDEAVEAGRWLSEQDVQVDIAYTSVLQRAIKTLWIALEESDQMWVPVNRSWRLNERHYGALQGENKSKMAERVGAEQVHQWRRSFDVRPPSLKRNDPRYPGRDRRYGGLGASDIPLAESLKDTIDRILPYWHETIAPAFNQANTILVVAHGNTLRALVKHLEHVSDEEIPLLNIPTGVPIVYQLNSALCPLNEVHTRFEPAVEA